MIKHLLGIYAPIFLNYHDLGFFNEVVLENPQARSNADVKVLEYQLKVAINEPTRAVLRFVVP